MTTLYIDVYFLINFCVDILALYFAASFVKIPCTNLRLVISGVIGGGYAVVGILLLDESYLMYPISAMIFISMVLIAVGKVSLYRRIKYAFAFFVFQIIIGGLVYYGYCLLDKVMKEGDYFPAGGTNRNLLILSLIVLLSIGVLKLVTASFVHTKSERSVSLVFEYRNNSTTFDALVDSGNLAVDPFDRTPVMFVKGDFAKKLFGSDVVSGSFKTEDIEIKKRLRIIPAAFGAENRIIYGLKCDSLYLLGKNGREKLSVVIAIDNVGKDYGGYFALMPISALDGVDYGKNT